MKKVIIILFILILSLLFCRTFANVKYESIPVELKKEYSIEMSNTIKSDIPIIKDKIKEVFYNAKNEKDEYNRTLIIEYGIDNILFDFYMKLINITEKYTSKNITNNIKAGDDISQLYEIINFYLMKNDINSSNLKNIIKYAQIQQKKLEKMYNYKLEI